MTSKEKAIKKYYDTKIAVCSDCNQWKPEHMISTYKKWVNNGTGGLCCSVCSVTDLDD